MLNIPTVTSSTGFPGLDKRDWNHRYGCEVDTQAGSSTVSVASHSSSEFESRSWDGDGSGRNSPPVGGIEGTGTTTAAPTRTRLKACASLFVPGGHTLAAPPPPPPPSLSAGRESAKVPVRCIIEGAFGNRLCGIHMADMQSHTEVEVVVSPHASERYGRWCMDPRGGAAHFEERSRALHVLLQAFKILGPAIKGIEPSADESKITLQYSEASTDRLCWEFGQHGYCPRGASCRWDHVAMEVFVITIVMQQLAMNASPAAISPSPGAPLHFGEFSNGDLPVPMVGYVIAAPMPPTIEQVPGMVYACPVSVGPMNPLSVSTNLDSTVQAACAVEIGGGTLGEPEPSSSTATGSSGSSGSTSPAGSPKPQENRVCWADIEDDEEP